MTTFQSASTSSPDVRVINAIRNNSNFGAEIKNAAREELEQLEDLIKSNTLNPVKQPTCGAEWEVWTVDSDTMRPVSRNLALLNDPTCPKNCKMELANCSIEINPAHVELTGNCFDNYESHFAGTVAHLDRLGRVKHDCLIALGGSLLTFCREDLTSDLLTPQDDRLNPYDRYRRVANPRQIAIGDGRFRAGDDNAKVDCNSIAPAAISAGLQPHLLVGPERLVEMLNICRAISPLLVAGCASTPERAGLNTDWESARIQTLVEVHRGLRYPGSQESRFTFGNAWQKTLSDQFEEATKIKSLFDKARESEELELTNMRLLMSFNWEFARTHYEFQDGKPHIRIELRVQDSALSTIDNTADMAWFYGLAIGLEAKLKEQGKSIATEMNFAQTRKDFFAAAKQGLESNVTWFGKKTSLKELGLALIPTMRQGLQLLGIAERDIKRYTNVIENRLKTGTTGAQWIRNSRAALASSCSREESARLITQSALSLQTQGRPVHTWPIPKVAR